MGRNVLGWGASWGCFKIQSNSSSGLCVSGRGAGIPSPRNGFRDKYLYAEGIRGCACKLEGAGSCSAEGTKMVPNALSTSTKPKAQPMKTAILCSATKGTISTHETFCLQTKGKLSAWKCSPFAILPRFMKTCAPKGRKGSPTEGDHSHPQYRPT